MSAPYYLVVEEWNYPTESGHDVFDRTYDSKEEALAMCEYLASLESVTFHANAKQDALPPEQYYTGYIITTKAGLDPFYYYARVVEVTPAVDAIVSDINKKAKEKHDHQ